MGAEVLVRATQEWSESHEGWALTYSRRNVWRVQPMMDEDDLMQEARMAFEDCKRAYPHITDKGHFMSLFMTSFKRAVDYYAYKRSRQYNQLHEVDLGEGQVLCNLRESFDHEFELELMCKDDPDFRRLVEAFLENKPPRKGPKISLSRTLMRIFPELASTNIDIVAYVKSKICGENKSLADCLVG